MFSTFNLNRRILWGLGVGLSLIALIALTESRQEQKRCLEVIVQLDKVDGHQFLSKRDVTGYLTNEGNNPVVGETFDKIDFRTLEQRLKRHGLVKNCQVSRDLKGNVVVSIEQPRPVARLVSFGSDFQFVGGQYVSEEGRFFPTSMNHTVRVPLLSGRYFANHKTLANSSSQGIMTLLTMIRKDVFWQAQITEIDISEQGAITLWPTYGTHRIELGAPINLELKFKKLKLFYKSVLSAKGWNRYSRVNVQYRNQIVCE